MKPCGVPFLAGLAIAVLFFGPYARSQTAPPTNAPSPPIRIISVEGKVERVRANRREAATANMDLALGDGLETGEYSRAVLLWYGSQQQISEMTRIRIAPTAESKRHPRLTLLSGLLYMFHRDNPGDDEIQTPTVYAIIRGTEFTLQVEENLTTHLALIDGSAEMTNQFGTKLLTSREQGLAEEGKAPVRLPARIEAVNDLIQWFLYYPAVLNLDELPLDAATKNALRDSLDAYRSGDLPHALEAYPAGRVPASDAEKIYRAGLLLISGQVAAPATFSNPCNCLPMPVSVWQN